MSYRALIPMPALVWGAFALHDGLRGAPYEASLGAPVARPDVPVLRVGLSIWLGVPGAPVGVRGPYRVTDETGAQCLLDRSGEGNVLPVATASADERGLVFGGFRYDADAVRLRPVHAGTLMVGKTAYRGDLLLVRREGRLHLINEVGLEEYLAGVLPCEMSLDSFPEAALRAQAIAARTYALFEVKWGELRGRTVGFDVYDDDRSQVYGGVTPADAEAGRIVAETAGIVATWKGRVFKAYFQSTCGGQTVSSWDVFHDTKIPPLSGVSCGHCADAPLYRWSAAFGKDEIRARWPGDGAAPGKVRGVRVTETIPGSPYAAQVEVAFAGGAVRTLAAGAFRLALLRREPPGPKRRAIPSLCFELHDAKDAVVLEGRGWGHGVGLCQTGARGLARSGASASEILQFYYPKAEIIRLY